MLKYRSTLKQTARTLRTSMTDAEQRLWSRLRRKQLLGVQFYRQKPVGPYVVDFYAPQAKLVVEVDGAQHLQEDAILRDRRRDAYMENQGLRVLRFDNLQVLKETESVVEVILEALEAGIHVREIPPSPPFTPARSVPAGCPLHRSDHGETKGGNASASDGDTVATLLSRSAATVAKALCLDPREARLEAQILLCHAIGQARAWLVAHASDPIPPEPARAFAALLQRRLGGEPIAYILGEREFYSLTFMVTPAVLIPRPETELLVELALARMPLDQPGRVLDLGTGSGAVAICLALQRPRAEVTAVDQSAAALAVAEENARRLGARNLRLLAGDWYSSLAGERFELIVSNPPYIAAADPHLSRGDLRFEPATALAAGADGLDDIRAIIQGAPRHLAPGGWLLFEHGYDQAAACRQLLAQAGFQQVASAADLAGIERVSLGQWPG